MLTKALIRFPVFLLLWAAFIAIKLPTMLLGLIVVPLLYNYRGRFYKTLPSWTRPWANPEDWTGGPKGWRGTSLPKWWVDREGEGFWAFYKYHAIRNPANGLRSFEWIDLDINPARVEYWTLAYLDYYEPRTLRKEGKRTAGYVCWQGWQAGVKLVHIWNDERHFVLKLGWRVEPRDKHKPIDPDGIRVDDSGFASKLLPYREG